MQSSGKSEVNYTVNIKDLLLMNIAYLLLGSNINKEKNIELAIKLLSKWVHVKQCSKIYHCLALSSDNKRYPNFYNIAVKIVTPYKQNDLKQHILFEIENQLERYRTSNKNSPRTIDLDILIFNQDTCLNFYKEIQYAHVLLPLVELIPDWEMPNNNLTLQQLTNTIDRNYIIESIKLNTSRNKKKYALITGATKRIGKSLALALALEDYSLILHYNKTEKLALKLKNMLTQHTNCELVQADFNKPSEIKKVFSSIFSKYDISVLINNAATFMTDQIGNLSDNYMLQWNVNFFAPYQIIDCFAKSKQKGQIINIIDSNINSCNYANYHSYLLTKKALQQLTNTAAMELSPNIIVNSLALGWILNPSDQDNLSMERKQKLLDKIPLQKKGSTYDVITSMLFLLKHSYITGQTLFIDGGQNLGFSKNKK